MIKLNFNFPVTDLDGTPAIQRSQNKDGSIKEEVIYMHKILGNALISPNLKKTDYIKNNTLAEIIYKGLDFEVDKADFELLKDVADQKEFLSPRVQYLLAMYLKSIC